MDWVVVTIIILAYCFLLKALLTVEKLTEQVNELTDNFKVLESRVIEYHSEKKYPPFKRDSIVVVKEKVELEKLAEEDPLYITYEIIALAGTLQKVHKIDYNKKRMQVKGIEFWIPFDCVILEKE